jgi:hypothetical protein
LWRWPYQRPALHFGREIKMANWRDFWFSNPDLEVDRDGITDLPVQVDITLPLHAEWGKFTSLVGEVKFEIKFRENLDLEYVPEDIQYSLDEDTILKHGWYEAATALRKFLNEELDRLVGKEKQK